MRSLFAFSGGGGGSGFPGSPVAGVYLPASSPEFLTVCAAVVAVQYSIVVDIAAGGVAWYSDGSAMYILGGSVLDATELPTPGTAGGVTFIINSNAAIFNQDDSKFYYFDGASWAQLNY